MKVPVTWMIALCVCASASAADLKPEQFAARFDLAAPGSGPHFRAALTADVVRHSQSAELADLRVFNAAGEPVPFALHRPSVDETQPETALALAVYPIEARVHQSAGAGGRMEIRQRGGATTVIIEGDRPGARTSDRVAAYLLDARQVKLLGVAVELDASFERAKLVPVTVEASRDLKSWRTIASGEPVFRLGEGVAQQTRTVVRFPRAEMLEGHFLRLTWAVSSQFDLRGASLLAIPAERPPDIGVDLGAPSRVDVREIEWNVPTPVRFTKLDVRLAQPNALVPVSVLGRRRAGEPWITIGHGVVYRIEQSGVESFSPALDMQPGSYQAIRLAIDGSGSFGDAAPIATLRMPPRELVFLARGAGPFVLTTGHADAKRASLPLATLVPGYKPDAEKSFALAAIGPVRIDPRRTVPAPTTVFGVDSRTATLWAILLGAVALLGVFAVSLLRKLKRTEAKTSPPD